MHFEWDPDKAVGNADKHGVAFEEACTVFADPLSATQENRFGGELRFITVGYSATGRLAAGGAYGPRRRDQDHQRKTRHSRGKETS